MVNKIIQFFMVLTRKTIDYSFSETYKFFTSFTLSSRRNLRNLDETTLENIEVNCNLNESLTLDKIGGYKCNSPTLEIQGTPNSMEIDTDKVDSISGIENINSQSLSTISNIDYSNLANLEKIDSLPEVTINNINGDTCSEDGQYIISGEINDISNINNKYSNVEITFSSPESSGLCEFEINDNKEITIICQNKEKFDISQIIIDRSLIQDSEGNYIFIINSYSSPYQFSCDISLNSIKAPEEKNQILESTSNNSEYSYEVETDRIVSGGSKKKKGGLSGGAIAGIVISCVVVVAVIGIIIILSKKGIINCKSNKEYEERPSGQGLFRTESQFAIK